MKTERGYEAKVEASHVKGHISLEIKTKGYGGRYVIHLTPFEALRLARMLIAHAVEEDQTC